MALEIHMVARLAVGLAFEEVVEADFVQRRGTGIGREVAADTGVLVGAHDHGGGVPTNEGANTAFDVFVARKERLSIWWDRVDVGCFGQRRKPKFEIVGMFDQPCNDVAGACVSLHCGQCIE